jgi:hypothetical protein
MADKSADKWADQAESALPLLIFLFLKDSPFHETPLPPFLLRPGYGGHVGG